MKPQPSSPKSRKRKTAPVKRRAKVVFRDIYGTPWTADQLAALGRATRGY